MTAISRIEGLLNSQLTGQVAGTTRSLPENQPQHSEREFQAPLSPRGSDPGAETAQAIRDVIDSQSQERIQAMVEQLKKTMEQYSAKPHAVGFRQDPVSDKVVIEIRNPQGDVIKQFPPEKLLNLHRRLDELSGIVIDRMT